jgi:hypothetical protein
MIKLKILGVASFEIYQELFYSKPYVSEKSWIEFLYRNS